jgi:two-component system sensor histidine kinase ChiS
MPSRKLLIVDDDVDFRGSLATVLREDGYDVREAKDGASAMTALSVERPTLILLDLMMPNGNGWSVLELLRTDHGFGDIPVVVISAYASSVPTGARSLLQKPVRREDLLATIRAYAASD